MYSKRLKEIRTYLRLTVNEIADKLNMKPRTYGSYEREENNVSIELVTSLCKNLNVNANWFVTGEGEMFNKKLTNNGELERLIDERFKILMKEFKQSS